MQDNNNSPNTPTPNDESRDEPPVVEDTSSTPEVTPTPDSSNDGLVATDASEDDTTVPPSAGADKSTAGVVSSQPGGKKKWMVIGGIVAGALVLLGGIGAAAYNVWYQNPDKVIGDAMVNVLHAKSVAYTGSMTVKDKGGSLLGDMKLTVDGKNTRTDSELAVKLTLAYGGKDYVIAGSGVVDKDGNLYVKINDTKKLIDTFTDGMELPASITSIVTKIDSRWIKISATDLKDFSEDYSKSQKCTTDVVKKYENDSAAINQIVDLYSKNRFIEVKQKLGSKNGSLGYVVDGNNEKAKSFAKGLNDTTIMKAMVACDDSFKIDSGDLTNDTESDSKSTSRVEVWVDRWSHQLTKIAVTDTSDASDTSLVFEPTFGGDIAVTVPKDTISLSELQADYEKAQAEYLQAMGVSTEVDTTSALDFSSEL